MNKSFVRLSQPKNGTSTLLKWRMSYQGVSEKLSKLIFCVFSVTVILSSLGHHVAVSASHNGTMSSGNDCRKQSVVIKQLGYSYSSVGIAAFAHEIYGRHLSYLIDNCM
jgi:hypothetical protein